MRATPPRKALMQRTNLRRIGSYLSKENMMTYRPIDRRRDKRVYYSLEKLSPTSR